MKFTLFISGNLIPLINSAEHEKKNRLKHSIFQSYELNDMDEINSLVQQN